MRRALALAFAVVLPLSAQDRPRPVFRTGTDVVRFDVRVTDAAGRPIPDLSADELEIREGGDVLPILLFQHVQEPAGTYVEAAARAVAAEVSSNAGAPRGHLYILVFDQHHITPGNEQPARRAAESFIRQRVRPTDRIAIFGIPGPGPQLNFTADRSRALTEITSVRGSLERTVATPLGTMSVQEAYEIARGNDRVLADVATRMNAGPAGDLGTPGGSGAVASRAIVAGTENPAVFRRLVQENARTVVAQADADARQFLQRLADLIRQYRAIEGRKTVVLFSEGFHNENVTRDVEAVAAAAAQSYVVFHAMDLNRRLGSLERAETPGADAGVEIQQRIEPLGSLAAETDGVLVNDATQQLQPALDRLAAAANDYYIVGFSPSVAARQNRHGYRRVSVTVKRPGARASARTGYAAGDAPADRRRSIDAALAAPFVQQSLRVEYTTYAMASEHSGKPRVILSLAAGVPVRSGKDDRADVVFVVRDVRDGRVVASGTDTMPMPETPSPGASTGLARHRVQFEVPPGSYMMRAVVREPGGLLGSADRRFDVQPFAGTEVAASDLVLGSAIGPLPVRAQAYPGDAVNGVLEIYARFAPQLEDARVVVDLIPENAAEPVRSISASLDPLLVTQAGGVMRRARFELPLGSIAPGAYIARAKVRTGDEEAAEARRQLDVLATGEDPPAAAPAEFRPEHLLEGDVVREFQQALRRNPAAPAAAEALRGLDLFAQGAYPEAAAALDAALRLDASSAATAFVLGWAHHAAGRSKDAIGAWRAAAVINPRLLSAHLALAEEYVRISEPALAAQALRAGLAALPDSPELKNRLAALEKRD
jgi:VWFA-related protein